MSPTILVERMRRQLARNIAAAEAVDRRRRLAGLTPEHRARHERFPGGICLQCISVDTRAATEHAAAVLGGGLRVVNPGRAAGPR